MHPGRCLNADVDTGRDAARESTEIARSQSERGEVALRRRTSELGADVIELRLNGVFVVDTQDTAAQIELAASALDLVPDPRHVVVCGLGLGFTTQRMLADPRVERVMIVEPEDALVCWMRDGTVPQGPVILADHRVKIVVADISTAVAEARSTYDLMLLGPDGADAGVHGPAFLARCRDLLNPHGALVLWSAEPAPELLGTLRGVFGEAEELAHDVALQDRPECFDLYVARPARSVL